MKYLLTITFLLSILIVAPIVPIILFLTILIMGILMAIARVILPNKKEQNPQQPSQQKPRQRLQQKRSTGASNYKKSIQPRYEFILKNGKK